MSPDLYSRYLRILGVEFARPSVAQLRLLVRAHLMRIPFENISKLYYLRRDGMRDIPDLPLYLDGIESLHFGGTCYSNNLYLYGLLRHLGYDADLCGADMSEPDVHIVIVVRLEGREYMVDVGYGAPFYGPMFRDLDVDIEIPFGNERWLVKPRDDAGRTRVEHYRSGELIHGYLAKPIPRQPGFFKPAIEDSFLDSATFMNAVRLVRYFEDRSVAIANHTVVQAVPGSCSLSTLCDRDDMVRAINRYFEIPGRVVREAVRGMCPLR